MEYAFHSCTEYKKTTLLILFFLGASLRDPQPFLWIWEPLKMLEAPYLCPFLISIFFCHPAKFTTCKPFRLTSAGSSQTFSEDEEKQDLEDPFYDLGNLWGDHWRAQPCPDFGPTSVHPVMHTKASDKRQEANR